VYLNVMSEMEKILIEEYKPEYVIRCAEIISHAFLKSQPNIG